MSCALGVWLLLTVLAVSAPGPEPAVVTTTLAQEHVDQRRAAPQPSVLDDLFPGGGVPWRPAAPVDDAGRAYVLPVDGVLRAPFRAPPQPWASGHRGVDLEAPLGTVVRSPGEGTVTFAGVVVGRPVVTVLHRSGRRSSLEPVATTLAVGAPVAAGTPIGTVATGSNHCAPVTCVHWGVREGDTYVDPLGLLPQAGPVVLLPVPAG